jgi:hypothetical protein
MRQSESTREKPLELSDILTIDASQVPCQRIIKSENEVGDRSDRQQLVVCIHGDFGERVNSNFVKSVGESEERNFLAQLGREKEAFSHDGLGQGPGGARDWATVKRWTPSWKKRLASANC